MKYIIQAAHVTNFYEVKTNINNEGIYLKKPEFIPTIKNEWKNILEFECDRFDYNETHSIVLNCMFGLPQINISETESVGIKERIFRADIGVTYLHSDKMLSEKDDKETNYNKYQYELAKYRDYIFDKYPKVKEHCDIYNPVNIFENIDKIKDKVINKKFEYKISTTKLPVSSSDIVYNDVISKFSSLRL